MIVGFESLLEKHGFKHIRENKELVSELERRVKKVDKFPYALVSENQTYMVFNINNYNFYKRFEKDEDLREIFEDYKNLKDEVKEDEFKRSK